MQIQIAWRDWVTEWWARDSAVVWKRMRRITQDDALADDVLQEALLKALNESPSKFENEAKFRAWVITVARNEANKVRRGPRYWRRATLAEDEPRGAGLDSAWRAKFNECVNQLSMDDWLLIRQHYYEGEKQKDIASMRGCSEAGVATGLSRAIDNLRRLLLEAGIDAQTGAFHLLAGFELAVFEKMPPARTGRRSRAAGADSVETEQFKAGEETRP